MSYVCLIYGVNFTLELTFCQVVIPYSTNNSHNVGTPSLHCCDCVLDKQNTLEVDAVTGATFSSYGILDAIDDALAKAE